MGRNSLFDRQRNHSVSELVASSLKRSRNYGDPSSRKTNNKGHRHDDGHRTYRRPIYTF